MKYNKIIIKQNIFLKKIEFIPFIIISILLFLFIFYKAYKVAFTDDESCTYLKFITGSFIKMFKFNEANNHFINTFLSNLSNFILANSELSLRLPNIIVFFINYPIVTKIPICSIEKNIFFFDFYN